MKLTTKLLKRLIKEELEKLDEGRWWEDDNIMALLKQITVPSGFTNIYQWIIKNFNYREVEDLKEKRTLNLLVKMVKTDPEKALDLIGASRAYGEEGFVERPDHENQALAKISRYLNDVFNQLNNYYEKTGKVPDVIGNANLFKPKTYSE